MFHIITSMALMLARGQDASAYTKQFSLTSAAFKPAFSIPNQYTCFGRDESLPLRFSNVPKAAVSLALVMSDIDAQQGPWYHWAVYNLSPNLKGLKKNLVSLPGNALPAKNSWGNAIYQGPCPPFGIHRYVVRLYALDTLLALPADNTVTVLAARMRGHVIAKAKLMGVVEGIKQQPSLPQ